MAKTSGGDRATKRSQAAAAPSGKAATKGARMSDRKNSTKSNAKDTRIQVKMAPAVGVSIAHSAKEPPEGLPPKYLKKSTFNTHDIMHSPVEKTLKMLDKILTGERLFTM